MTDPKDLLYTPEHEWVADAAGPTARVGLTDFATRALGDIVFLDLPAVGATVEAGQACGEIESTKSVSTLYSPVSGTVSAVNQAAVDAPEQVNAEPYGAGWLFEVASPTPGAGLLDAAGYGELTAAAA